MDETPQDQPRPEGDSSRPTEPTAPSTQPSTQPTQPLDPWANPDSVAHPVPPVLQPPASSQPTQPVQPPLPVQPTQPVQPIAPVQPVSQPTQPYGDPYAAGYTGAAWGTSNVPPVDPWLPLSHSMPQTEVLDQNSDKTGSRRRYGGLTLVAAAVLGGLISAAGVSAVVIATRPANEGSSSSFSSSAAASTANTSIDRSRPAGTVAAVAEAVLPSVVSILETSGSSAGEGSGIVLDAQGHILTNNHVVADAADGGTLTVTFQDGSSEKATIVGRDPLTDIAVIKVAPTASLKPARLGSSATLRVGDQVVAIGSPLGLSGTVTEGIVSALNRPVVTQQDANSSTAAQAAISAIQTDAAINPGNSGGALVDADGAVVGINSAIATVPSQSQTGQAGNIGVGFAIPIDQAKRIAGQLIAGQTPAHAVLGVTLDQSQSSFSTVGARVAQLTSSSGAAAKAGIKAGDVISQVNGEIVQGPDGLRATIRSFAPGTTVDITYVRGGVDHTIKVTLGTDAKG